MTRARVRDRRRLAAPTFALGDSLEVYLRRDDAERFIEDVRCDEPELTESLRIEERELRAGELN